MKDHLRLLLGLIAIAVCRAPLHAAGDQRLVDAARNRDLPAVRALLQQRVDVNAPQPDGATALHWAVYADDAAMTTLLVRAGANVSAANELGATPIYLAAQNRNAAIAETLLAAGANPNASLPSGESAVMTAARTGSADVIKTLVAHGAQVNHGESNRGETALMWAVASGHPEVVKTLVEVGANPMARADARHRRVQVGQRFSDHDARTTAYVDLGGFTPLLFAARQGHVESARVLLAAGADVNDRSASGTTALVIAAHSDQRAVAELLLEKGADPNDGAGGYTALHAAVLRGNLELVRALLARGAMPNTETTKGTPVRYVSKDYALSIAFLGATPYWLAAKFGEPEMMRALFAGGADPRAAIKDGTTPLIAALSGTGGTGAVGTTADRRDRILTPTEIAERDEAAEDRIAQDTVRLALDFGSDIDAATQSGDTALHTASSRGNVAAVERLLALGASVNVANKNGDTPLHNAASRAFPTVIQLLGRRGADLVAKNKKGQTPLAVTAVQVGIGGASFIPESARKSAANALRELGATE